MDRITTTIRRHYLAEIIDGTKTVEYRENKPYWRKKLASVTVPFELRLINGMQPKAPEVTVLIDRVTESKENRQFRLRIARVLSYRNWSACGRSSTNDAPRSRR